MLIVQNQLMMPNCPKLASLAQEIEGERNINSKFILESSA